MDRPEKAYVLWLFDQPPMEVCQYNLPRILQHQNPWRNPCLHRWYLKWHVCKQSLSNKVLRIKYLLQWWVELDDELSWLFTNILSATRYLKVKTMGKTEIMRRIWLFSANKTKSSKSFRKQSTQLIETCYLLFMNLPYLLDQHIEACIEVPWWFLYRLCGRLPQNGLL